MPDAVLIEKKKLVVKVLIQDLRMAGVSSA
jgi:hypothetical protein